MLKRVKKTIKQRNHTLLDKKERKELHLFYNPLKREKV